MRHVALRLVLLPLLLSIPALATGQDADPAKKLFDSMEPRLRKAKSVTLSFRLEAEIGGENLYRAKGSLAIAQGDRVRLEAEGTNVFKPNRARVTIISDDKSVR